MAAYLLDLLTLWALFASAATIVAVLAEEAGFLHVGASAMIGVGAYTVALLSTKGNFAPPVALLGTIVIGVIAGCVMHLLLRRFQNDILALATLAIGILSHGIMLNAEAITGGAMGIAGIPKYVGLTPFKALDASILLGIVLGLILAMRRTTFGKRIRALRDDEVLADELGLNPAQVRLVLWVASATVLSLVGGIYAFHLRFIDPSSFTVRESVAILAMALMIPAPTLFNASLGALVFIALPEVFRFLGLPSSAGAELRQLLFGVVLIVVVARAGGTWRGPYAMG